MQLLYITNLYYMNGKDIIKKFKEKVKETDLYYVDYRDCFEDNQLNDLLHGTYDECELFDYWDTIESEGYYVRENLTAEEVNFVQENDEVECELRDYIREVDTSNPIKDLLNNTDEKQLHYYIDGTFIYEDSSNLNEELRRLGIKIRENKEAIEKLREWNYYGGELQILFKIEDYYDYIKNYVRKDGKRKIVFTDPCIALTDTSGGSGGYADFIGTIELPFDAESVVVDSQSSGYSITGVYGNDDLGDSEFEIKETRSRKKAEKDPKIEEYKKRDELVKNGSCDFYDPRFNSHKTEYENIPLSCGWKCKNCGRFFID